MNTLDEGTALCAPFMEHLPVAGLSISVLSPSGAQSTVATTDEVATRLEELQFLLGEGPTPVVMRTGHPVMVCDLTLTEVHRDWPMFGLAAMDTGARGLFSFPLSIDVVTVGVVSLYSLVVSAPWSATLMGTAVDLAAATSAPAVDLASRTAEADASPPDTAMPVEMRREVHQASGMVMVQLGSSIDEALARLRAHAFSEGRPIDAVAHDVVTGRLKFERTS